MDVNIAEALGFDKKARWCKHTVVCGWYLLCLQSMNKLSDWMVERFARRFTCGGSWRLKKLYMCGKLVLQFSVSSGYICRNTQICNLHVIYLWSKLDEVICVSAFCMTSHSFPSEFARAPEQLLARRERPDQSDRKHAIRVWIKKSPCRANQLHNVCV